MRHRRLKIPHPYRQSVKLDPIDARDFQKHKMIFCCEQCSHFSPSDSICTIGYESSPHLRANNLKSYELTGRMALCRFLEID